MIKVTCDPSADLKLLRKLEIDGLIELWGVAIEQISGTRRISKERKPLPIAVIGSDFARIGSSKIASSETHYKAIQEIIGHQHHADILHLEDHIQSGRDIFATSDTDFLKHRSQLEKSFSIKIRTAEEITKSLR